VALRSPQRMRQQAKRLAQARLAPLRRCEGRINGLAL